MLNTVTEAGPTEYARPILLSLYPMLDRVEHRLPRPPEANSWQGQAKTQYAIRLGLLSEATTIIRMHLDGAVEALQSADSCG